MMHAFARNYLGSFNGRHGRTGALWEGRYKACLVDSWRYFLACGRYIELNLVRAWLVAQPNEYFWLSYGAYAEDCTDSLLSPHPDTFVLDSDPVSRISAYRGFIRRGVARRTCRRDPHSPGATEGAGDGSVPVVG